MRTVLSGICLLIASIACAQRQCASATYMDQQLSADPAFASKLNGIENFVRQKNAARESGEGAPGIYLVPVVVHVLYKTEAQNISDAQIQSQIDALNRDFRRRNADSVNTPERFKALAADIQIEFQLATADPRGRATNGIIRKPTTVNYWSTDDRIKFSSQGGDDAWDTRYYLNIWVGNLSTMLGYSTMVGAPAEKDGIVINVSVFGTINTPAPYDKGRTTTHEVGHWLGLKHIWGDSYCGDDLVDDTPRQGNFTSGCPDTFRSSCTNGETGDMYMNYMDFTHDACMNLFTVGQKQRMYSLFYPGGPRNLLLTSKGLNQPWVVDAPVATPQFTTFRLYPNPTGGEMVLNFEYDPTWVGKLVSVVSVNGAVVSQFRITAKTQTIGLHQLKPGVYFIQAENGGRKLREKFIRL